MGSVPTVCYIPDFISAQEEARILQCIYALPAPQWTQLQHRRLQQWPPDAAGAEARATPDGHPPAGLPPWLAAVCESLVGAGVFPEAHAPNHVLVNEYLSGQGIMAHTDGPSYWPLVAIISLQSTACMHFQPRLDTAAIGRGGAGPAGPVQTLVLRPRSLLVFAEAAFTDHLHGIDAVEAEVAGARAPVANAELAGCRAGEEIVRGTRLSLTVRQRLG